MSIRRRNLLLGVGASTLVMAGRLPNLRAQTQAPFRLPIILPISGPPAPYGAACRMGAELAAEFVNSRGGVNGQPLDIQFLDDQGAPQQAIARAREVIGDGHKLFVGGLLSSLTTAMLPLLPDSKTVLLIMGSVSLSINHELYTRFMFHGQDDDYQRNAGFARIAVERYPEATNWGAILTDLATYRDAYDFFIELAGKSYAAKGIKPKFNPHILAKYGTTDFHAQIAQLQALNIDALYHELVGSDCISFWQQARGVNLGKSFKLVLDESAIDFGVAKALGTSLPPNLWSVVQWYPGLYPNDPVAQSLAQGAAKRTGDRYPSPFLSYGHLPVMVFAQAMKATNGSNDPDQIIRAIENGKFATELGTISYRKEDHQVLADVDYVNIVPQPQEPGFSVADSMKFPGAELIEPPSPGAKFKL